MPFALAPVLWSRLRGKFVRNCRGRERAHNDGVLVEYDSPEVFEEVFWLSFWPAKYGADLIYMWQNEQTRSEAVNFLHAHMRKAIALRRPRQSIVARYLSRNNSNIARIDYLAAEWPDSKILVPIR